MTLSIVHLYYLVGAILAITALMTLADRQHTRRYSSAFFWGLYSLVFLVGDLVPPVWVGVGVVVMALIAAFGGVGIGGHRARTPQQYLDSAKSSILPLSNMLSNRNRYRPISKRRRRNR